MLSNREVYNPEFRIQAEAVRKRNEELGNGKNLDQVFLKQLKKLSHTVDKMMLDAIRPHRKLPESSSEYSKIFGPLVTTGIVTGSMFSEFLRFWGHKKELENEENYAPREITISRYSPSISPDDKMPGSILAFSKEEMKEQIKRAKRLDRDFSKTMKKIGKNRDALKRIFGK